MQYRRYLFRRCPPKAASKDRQALENILLIVGEELPGVVKHSADAALACGEITALGVQEIQARADLRQDAGLVVVLPADVERMGPLLL